MRTDDGAVQLYFQPIAANLDQRDYKLVRSRFVQPVGVFDGTIRVDGISHKIAGLPGVTEDQDVLW